MSKTLHFKIILIESKPLIWRTFKVSDEYRMDRFHQVLQIVMGWNNSHLHEFKIKGHHLGMVDDMSLEYSPDMKEETKSYLRDFDLVENDTFTYFYDFGDSWSHVLYVKESSNEHLLNPECTDGERACPPDDCGGIWGYSNLLDILKDPDHSEYDGYIEWLPDGFNPDHFSKQAVNEELERFGIWHRKYPKKKSTPWHLI
jgi:hypothetical protein